MVPTRQRLAKKVTGQHEGNINLVSGSLMMNDGILTGGSFVVDMTSLNTTDLQGNSKQKLEGHLKSNDFFGVATYPQAKLVFTSVESKGSGLYTVTGDFTIKGPTEIMGPANVMTKPTQGAQFINERRQLTNWE